MSDALETHIRDEAQQIMRELADAIAERANAMDEDLNDVLPPSVDAMDLRLRLISAVQDGLGALVAWQGAYARSRGATTEHIARQLGYSKGAHLRRAYPEIADVETALSDGTEAVNIRGFTILLDPI